MIDRLGVASRAGLSPLLKNNHEFLHDSSAQAVDYYCLFGIQVWGLRANTRRAGVYYGPIVSAGKSLALGHTTREGPRKLPRVPLPELNMACARLRGGLYAA